TGIRDHRQGCGIQQARLWLHAPLQRCSEGLLRRLHVGGIQRDLQRRSGRDGNLNGNYDGPFFAVALGVVSDSAQAGAAAPNPPPRQPLRLHGEDVHVMAGSATGGPPTTKAAGRIGQRKEAFAGYSFVAIPMLFFLVLSVGVLFYALFISLWKWNIRSGPQKLIGIDNYTRILGDPLFQTAVKNSLYYALVWVPLTMALGLFLAVSVNQKIRGQ